MGTKRAGEYPSEIAARGTRTSRTAQGVALSERQSKSLGKAHLMFVMSTERLITHNRVYYWLRAKLTTPNTYWLRAKLIAFHIVRRLWHFTFNGREYHYLYHPYNWTWRNERAVELPIIWEEVEKVDAERVLELGNVLSHYYDVHHDIVDKHEKGNGVINSDICDFHMPKMYDLIVSISTIEHIGFDEDYPVRGETIIQPEKWLRVIQLLKGMLSMKGKLVVTVPLGYNLTLDRALREDTKSIFTRIAYMKRISKSNKWAEVEQREVHDAKYGSPFYQANVLAICIFESSTSR
jgi:hypothetical protein